MDESILFVYNGFQKAFHDLYMYMSSCVVTSSLGQEKGVIIVPLDVCICFIPRPLVAKHRIMHQENMSVKCKPT